MAENETEIEQLLQRALHVDPGHATSLYNLADLYRQRGELQRAAYYLAHCLKYTPCLPGAEAMLADIRRRLAEASANEKQQTPTMGLRDRHLSALESGGYGRLAR